MTRGALTARFAVLVSEFKLRPWEIADLTPRQVAEVYFHPRDKHGAVQLPEVAPAEGDPAARLGQLLALAPALGLPAAQVEELKRRLEALTNGDAPRAG